MGFPDTSPDISDLKESSMLLNILKIKGTIQIWNNKLIIH